MHFETDTNIISISLDNYLLWKSFFNDSKHISYHIFNKTDTVEFSLIQDTIILIDGLKFRTKINNGYYKCESCLVSIDKEHNYCQVLKDGQPYTGEFSSRLVGEDSIISVFEGNLLNGYINDGSIVSFFPNGKIKMTGQFIKNWKFGIWNTYYNTGKIKEVIIYKAGYNFPLVEFRYSKFGELVHFNDNESGIRIDSVDRE